MVKISLSPTGKKGADFSADLPSTILPDEGLPEGMEPMWEGAPFYQSPQIVDIRDCQWYPQSPGCGGSGFSSDPVSLEAELTMDECGRVNLTLSGTFAFVHTPNFQYSYVPDHCRNDKPEINPPPPPGEPRTPIPLPKLVAGRRYLLAVGKPECVSLPNLLPCASLAYDFTRWEINTECLYYQYNFIDAGYRLFPPNRNVQYQENRDALTQIYIIECFTGITNSPPSYLPGSFLGRIRATTWDCPLVILEGEGSLLLKLLQQQVGVWVQADSDVDKSAPYARKNTQWNYFQEEGWAVIDHIELNRCCRNCLNDPPPPPKLPPEKCDCMSCCSQSKNDLEDIRRMLRQILKQQGNFPSTFKIFDTNENAQEAQSTDKSIPSIIDGVKENSDNINKLAKIIGIDQLPITAPESLIDPINDNWLSAAWDFITPDATVKIKSVIEFQKYLLDYINASIGHLQQEISVTSTKTEIDEETGEVKEVEVKEKIVVADLATSVKELILMSISQYKATGMINDMVFKLLIQTALTQKESAKISAIVQDIQQYLDYPTREKTLQTRIQITPPADNVPDEDFNEILKILQPSDAKFKFDDWTGENSLTDLIINIASLASRNRGG